LPCHTDALADADVIVPALDVAAETNWPYYGEPGRAFVRGDLATYAREVVPTIAAYLDRFCARRVLIVDMNPFSSLPKLFGNRDNAIFALASADRAAVRAGVDFGMPAFPLYSRGGPTETARPVLASFVGYNSHPVRERLRALDDGRDIVVRVCDRRGYVGSVSIDETAASSTAVRDFDRLAASSVFSFVPRGDALFSYRLLEVMRCGSIPVILSDGWLLPFAEIIEWSSCALVVPEAEVAALPGMLRAMPPAEVRWRQDAVARAYATHLADFPQVAAACAQSVALALRAGLHGRAAAA
jgi:hypothetical protein